MPADELDGSVRARLMLLACPSRYNREKDAKYAQKLGQLQPCLSLFSHRNAWANWYILGQPNTFLANSQEQRAELEIALLLRGGRLSHRRCDHFPAGRSILSLYMDTPLFQIYFASSA
jgi:hypothetical protein